MVIVAIIGMYIAITMAWTFWLLPFAAIIFFICMLLFSLAMESTAPTRKKDE